MKMTKAEIIKQIQEILSADPVQVQIAKLLRRQGICEKDIPNIMQAAGATQVTSVYVQNCYRDIKNGTKLENELLTPKTR